MDYRQKCALGALASMARQFLHERSYGVIDSEAMSAAEHAIYALSEYGYMEEVGAGRIMGRWTDIGKALLDWDYPFNERENKPFPMPTIMKASS